MNQHLAESPKILRSEEAPKSSRLVDSMIFNWIPLNISSVQQLGTKRPFDLNFNLGAVLKMGRLQSSNFAGLVVALMGWVWSNTREKGWIHISWYLMFIYIHLEYSIHRCPSVNSKNWLETGNVPDSKERKFHTKWSMFHRSASPKERRAKDHRSWPAGMLKLVEKKFLMDDDFRGFHGIFGYGWRLGHWKQKVSHIVTSASMTVHDRWTSKTLLKCKNNKLQNSLDLNVLLRQIILLGTWYLRSHSIYLFHQPIENPGKSMIMEFLYPSFRCENARMTLVKNILDGPFSEPSFRRKRMMNDDWWMMMNVHRKDCKYIVLYLESSSSSSSSIHNNTFFEFGRKHGYMIPVSGFLTPPTPPQCDDPVHTTHCSNDYNMAASLLLEGELAEILETPLHAVTKAQLHLTIVSKMIPRVLPIHVPPCYEGDTLSLLH